MKQKFEVMSSHTSRRTFITLSLKKGVLPELVMKIVGIKSHTVFQQAVKQMNFVEKKNSSVKNSIYATLFRNTSAARKYELKALKEIFQQEFHSETIERD